MPITCWNRVAIAAAILGLSGCAGISRSDGQALGKAGQAATGAISDQAGLSADTLGALPSYWAVGGRLKCVEMVAGPPQQACLNNASDPNFMDASPVDLSALRDVMRARKAAAAELMNAYRAFGDLATYDAGQETQAAITKAFGAVDGLLGAVSKLNPSAAAIQPISATVIDVTANFGGLIASENQRARMLAASKNLHLATNALIKALDAEQVSAETILAQNFAAQRGVLYRSYLLAGLVSPSDILAPQLAQIAPGTQIVKAPPAANLRIINAAASAYIDQRIYAERDQISASYKVAIGALQALASQHVKLEKQESIDVTDIMEQAQRVAAIIGALTKK